MAINISSNFLVGVRDFLDSRQRVETRAGLDSINTFFIPDMFIVYCEEEDCYYQYKEATESWLMLDLNINEYLYELDENGEPDLTKPIYIEEERMVQFDENIIRAWIDDGGQLTAEDELLDYIIDDSIQGAENKTYSSEYIESKYNELYENFKTYTDERLTSLSNIIYIKIDSVDEMDREDVFYLIEDGSNKFNIYVLDEYGMPIELGSSEMDISGFQPLRDPSLTTTSKNVVTAMNEVYTRYNNTEKLIGDVGNLAVPKQDSLYIAASYTADQAKTVGKVNELTTNDKTDIVNSINELSKEVGLLRDLKMSDNSSIVNAINSFASEIISVGSIIAFAGPSIPENYLTCNGGTFLKKDYPLLFEVMPDSFKISETQCRLPSLTDTVVAYGDTIGQYGGEPFVRLTLNQSPPHVHTCSAQSHYHSGWTGYQNAFSAPLYYGTNLAKKVSSRSNYTIWYTSSNVDGLGKHNHKYTVKDATHTHTSYYTGYGGADLTSAYVDSIGNISYAHNNTQPSMYLRYIIKAK